MPGLHVSVRSWGGPGKAPEAEYQAYYPVLAFTPPTTHIVVMVAFQDFPLGHFLFVTAEIKKWFPLVNESPPLKPGILRVWEELPSSRGPLFLL